VLRQKNLYRHATRNWKVLKLLEKLNFRMSNPRIKWVHLHLEVRIINASVNAPTNRVLQYRLHKVDRIDREVVRGVLTTVQEADVNKVVVMIRKVEVEPMHRKKN